MVFTCKERISLIVLLGIVNINCSKKCSVLSITMPLCEYVRMSDVLTQRSSMIFRKSTSILCFYLPIFLLVSSLCLFAFFHCASPFLVCLYGNIVRPPHVCSSGKIVLTNFICLEGSTISNQSKASSFSASFPQLLFH